MSLERNDPNSCSVHFQPHNEIWREIVEDFDKERAICEENLATRNPPRPQLPFYAIENTPWGFLEVEVFPILLPALKSMLYKAEKWKSLKYHKTRFNGLDHLAELLWNFNPRFPGRYKTYTDIYSIPFVQEILEKTPRPFFPFSYIWNKSFAATVIQSHYRGHLVRKTEEVQEMRQFWKDYFEEKFKDETVCHCPDIYQGYYTPYKLRKRNVACRCPRCFDPSSRDRH